MKFNLWKKYGIKESNSNWLLLRDIIEKKGNIKDSRRLFSWGAKGNIPIYHIENNSLLDKNNRRITIQNKPIRR